MISSPVDSRKDEADSTRVVVHLPDFEGEAPVRDWFQHWSDYEYLTGSDASDGTHRVDLCLVDRTGFEWFERRLAPPGTGRDATGVPCLLVLPDQREKDTLDWAEIEETYDGLVDDVLVEPLRKLDLRSSIESAIRGSRGAPGLDGPRLHGTEFESIDPDTTRQADTIRLLGVFDRILRHNLRNEVNVLIGQAEVIERTTTGDAAARAESIVETANELLTRADKEREIVRLLRQQVAPTEQDLTVVVDRAMRNVRATHPEAMFEVSMPETCHAEVLPVFQQAVEELLTNAVVHNDASSPTVTVTLTTQSSTVELAIADTGPGIPEQEIEVLHDSESIEPLYHGSGLGLWLVHWITVLSGGRVEFEANDPRGSVVTLRFNWK